MANYRNRPKFRLRYASYQTLLVQIKFGLRPDIRSDIDDQTKFWTVVEDQTECLSPLERELSYRKQIARNTIRRGHP